MAISSTFLTAVQKFISLCEKISKPKHASSVNPSMPRSKFKLNQVEINFLINFSEHFYPEKHQLNQMTLS